MPTEAESLFAAGTEMLAQGNILSALACFEKAVRIEDRPIYSSHLAFCIAKERGQHQLAVTLCQKAIAREPQNPLHYLNLGRIYLMAGKKAEAVNAFRQGLQHEEHRQIIDELNRLGTRRPPVIRSLKRSNPVNKYLGIILNRLGLR